MPVLPDERGSAQIAPLVPFGVYRTRLVLQDGRAQPDRGAPNLLVVLGAVLLDQTIADRLELRPNPLLDATELLPTDGHRIWLRPAKLLTRHPDYVPF
jgi:hypothetical protein